jgi:hypothetical protein
MAIKIPKGKACRHHIFPTAMRSPPVIALQRAPEKHRQRRVGSQESSEHPVHLDVPHTHASRVGEDQSEEPAATARAETRYTYHLSGPCSTESVTPTNAAGPTMTFGSSWYSRSVPARATRARTSASAKSSSRPNPNS